MENVGAEDIINPWLSNGRNRFRNLAEIVARRDHARHDRRRKGLRASGSRKSNTATIRAGTTTSCATR